MRIIYTAKKDFEAGGANFHKGMKMTLIQHTSEYVKVSPYGLEKYMTLEVPVNMFDEIFGNTEVIE